MAINVKTFWISTVALAVLLAASPVRANVILNGSFESGDFSDWITVPDPVDQQFFVNGSAHSGVYAAWFGAIGDHDDTIAQAFATDPGQRYQIDFWLAHGAANFENDFNVFWNAMPVLNILDAGSFRYTHYTFIETALGPSSTLQLAARDAIDFFYLDDVNMTAIATPEPATLLLVGAGLGVIRARRRRESTV